MELHLVVNYCGYDRWFKRVETIPFEPTVGIFIHDGNNLEFTVDQVCYNTKKKEFTLWGKTIKAASFEELKRIGDIMIENGWKEYRP